MPGIKRVLKLILGALGIAAWLGILWAPARSGIAWIINHGIPILNLVPIQLGILILAGIAAWITSLASKHLVDWESMDRLKQLRSRLTKELIKGKQKRVEHLQRELISANIKLIRHHAATMLYSAALIFPMIIWGWVGAESGVHLSRDQITQLIQDCPESEITLQNLAEIQECWHGSIQQLSKLLQRCGSIQQLDECLRSGTIRLEPYLEFPILGPRSLDHRILGWIPIPYWLIWFSLCYMPFHQLSRRLLKLPTAPTFPR